MWLPIKLCLFISSLQDKNCVHFPFSFQNLPALLHWYGSQQQKTPLKLPNYLFDYNVYAMWQLLSLFYNECNINATHELNALHIYSCTLFYGFTTENSVISMSIQFSLCIFTTRHQMTLQAGVIFWSWLNCFVSV